MRLPEAAARSPAEAFTLDAFLARAENRLSHVAPGPGVPLSNPRGDHDLQPEGFAVAPATPHRPAAVLVPVIDRPEGVTLLFTQRAAHLRDQGLSHLYVVDAVAGFCVNSTVRSAADLGFVVTVVRDAVIGFDLPSAALDAQTVFDVTMGLLEADFATLRDSAALLQILPVAASGLVDP